MPRRIWMYLLWTALSFSYSLQVESGYCLSHWRGKLSVRVVHLLIRLFLRGIRISGPRILHWWGWRTCPISSNERRLLFCWLLRNMYIVSSIFLSFSFSLPFGPRCCLVNSHSFISFNSFFFTSPLSSCHFSFTISLYLRFYQSYLFFCELFFHQQCHFSSWKLSLFLNLNIWLLQIFKISLSFIIYLLYLHSRDWVVDFV